MSKRPYEDVLDSFEEGEVADEASTPTLRLVVYHSTQNPSLDLLSARHTLVLIDETTTIGRDRSFDSRIRLKSLEVSKCHATLFYEQSARRWSIVDSGSTHGTFIKSKDDSQWCRLSEKGKSSLPRPLKHLDTIKVATQRFIVHQHSQDTDSARESCPNCAYIINPDGSDNVVPLTTPTPTPTAVAGQATQRKSVLNAAGDLVYENDYQSAPFEGVKTKEEKHLDYKADIKNLRNAFLSSSSSNGSWSNIKRQKTGKQPVHGQDTLQPTTGDQETTREEGSLSARPAYIDRAKLRRALYPASESDSHPPRYKDSGTLIDTVAPVPSAPSYGVGQALYNKMIGSDEQGSDLSATSRGSTPKVMGEVIQVRTTNSRNAGLGHGELIKGVENIGSSGSERNWKQEARERRWRETQGS